MKEFEALKTIWEGQIAQPKMESEDILKEVRRSKRGFANKLLFETLATFIVITLLVIIWIKTPFMMWTTHLSMAIFISCCLYYLFVQYRDYKSINNSELLLKKPDEYIDYLKIYQKKRHILNTQKYMIYSIFIGIGFALYFIEIYFVAPLWQTLLGIAFILIWFVLCWLLMRIYRNREEKKIEDMIENLVRLQKQFNEE